MNDNRGKWKSKITFVFAAAGSAVGLGNLWRFSYVAGNNGGGLFVLIYLIAVLFIGLPILLSELSIGRFSNKDTVGAFEAIKSKTKFKGIGYLGLVSAIMILAFYSVIAGQTVGYVFKSAESLFKPKNSEFSQLSGPAVTQKPTSEFIQIINQPKGIEEKKIELHKYFEKYNLIEKKVGENKKLENREHIRNDLSKGEFKPDELLIKSLGLIDRSENKEEINGDLEKILKEIEIKLLVNKSSDIFSNFEAQKHIQIILLLIFLFLTIFIVSKGVSGGIERFTKVFMPVLLIILLIMIIRAVTLPNALKGIIFYLTPKFSEISPKLIISAIGQAFFSLSLGMGTMITYGSYVSKRENLPNSAGMIAFFDTGIAILAGFIVFPVIFSLSMSPQQGAGGIFIVLPILFSKIPLGQIFAVLFFILLGIAALTSTISLLEVPVAYMIDQKGWKRKKAAYLLGFITLIFAIPCALFSIFFKIWDTVWGSFALTIGGLFISIFVGWVWKPLNALKEIKEGSKAFKLAGIWSFVIKYLIPLFIIVILISNIIELFK